MRIGLTTAFILLVALPVTAEEKPKDLKDHALQERINAAIDRGVAHLKKTQQPDGTWGNEFGAAGQTALALFTLVSSGVRSDDPHVKKAVAFLTKLPVKKGTPQDLQSDPPAIRMTYAHSLAVLALTTLDAKKHRRAIQRSVRALVESQKPSGQWAYIVSMGGPLDGGDNSNTQFALLALRRAALAGIPVPRAVWQRAYRHFESTIREDGGWGYGCETMEGSYGSMTAVGIASLVICKAMLLGNEKAPSFDYLKLRPIIRGMVWLEERFAVDEHPGIAKVVPAGAPGGAGGPGAVPGRSFQYYWLYSLERVGMLLGRRHIGDHDWYREGAEWLLAVQEKDGGWVNGWAGMVAPEPPLAATCFALLFLKKATLPVVTPPVRRK